MSQNPPATRNNPMLGVVHCMRNVWLMAFLFALSASVAFSASQTFTRVKLHGTDYIPLSEWTRANGLRWSWIKRDATLYVTNAGSKVLLIANSREAKVNNIEVWLLFPTVNRSGTPMISRMDAENTLRPILFPSRNPAGAKVRNICIDPGHGGKDPGNRLGSQYEREYTLRLAREVADQLKRAGLNVTLTRTNNATLDLSTRPAIAKRRKADLFISLHFNSVVSGKSTVKGAETFALTPDGARSTSAGGKGPLAGFESGNRFDDKNVFLAYEIQKNLVRKLGVEDRGVRRARFQVLREATMPSVLVEGGFMSHPTESKKIFDAAYRREMARAIADGILSYKRAVEGVN
jgi:N-acetylmuramoyl-L-alanine amidase